MTRALPIEPLSLPASAADVRALALLLIDAVESGAAVSFVLPLSLEAAEAWWQKTLTTSHPRAVFLVARDTEGIVGTVQMHPAWAPNQPHRGDVVKLIVHRRAQRSGLGARLMGAIEMAARDAGLTLLTLDAKRGMPAERLYRRLGWTCVGVIPDFALDPDRRALHDTVVFYKRVDASKSDLR